MPPVIRNAFIRLFGFLSRIFTSIRTALSRFFSFWSRIFGFGGSQVALEADDARGFRLAESSKTTDQSTLSASSTEEMTFSQRSVGANVNRRRSDPDMDRFRKMARETLDNKQSNSR